MSDKPCPTPDAISAAIRATEYKYFGDYEMSDSQREAVETLVAVAQYHQCRTDELAQVVAWLRKRHDDHMASAGWAKVNDKWQRMVDVDVATHNEWTSKANEAYAIRSYLESGALKEQA